MNSKHFSIISCFLLLLVAQKATAVEYGGIGGRPAFPRADNQRTESIFVHSLGLGEIKDEGVKVLNNTNEEKTIFVYAVDSAVSSGGAFSCAAQGDAKSDVGNWIDLEKTEVTLKPSSNEIVPFKIIVPQNADVGEHNGCIILQEKKNAKADSAGIAFSFRTGLRVAVMIPGEIKKDLQIVGMTMTRETGKIKYHPSVKNNGNVSVDATVKISTTNFLGQSIIEHGGGYPVLRGQQSDWNFEFVNPYWGGWYKAKLTVGYDEDIKAEIGKSSGNIKTLTGPTIWYFVMPNTMALLVELAVLALILTLVVYLIIRSRRMIWIKANWILTPVAEGADILSLAKQYQVSWKLIAKVNNLEAPYTLRVGDKLKLPPK